MEEKDEILKQENAEVPVQDNQEAPKRKNKLAIALPIIVLILLSLLYVLAERVSWYQTTHQVNGEMFFAKPVVYLYPVEETSTTVKIEPSDGVQIKTTYPKLHDEWRITASKDGILADEAGRQYDYLFYDASADVDLQIEDGYCVHRDELIPFFEGILKQYGLNEREANEFIVYWLPLLEENEYNLISFVNEWYEDAVELKINPAPDNVLRLFMLYKPLDKAIEIEPQEIPEFNRTGFVVVEWGGAKI